MLQNAPDGIALDEEHEFYYTLDKHELREIGTHHASHPIKIFNLVKNKSCIMAIFNNRNADIDSLCKYAIVTNTLKPAIYHLTQTTYLLNNIASYTVRCGRGEKVQIE